AGDRVRGLVASRSETQPSGPRLVMRTENGFPVRGMVGVKKGLAAIASRNSAIRPIWTGRSKYPGRKRKPGLMSSARAMDLELRIGALRCSGDNAMPGSCPKHAASLEFPALAPSCGRFRPLLYTTTTRPGG